jgi:RimJ/RimL family protein N-acetyltransferase
MTDIEQIADLQPRPFPERVRHAGRFVSLEPLDVSHVDELWDVAADAGQSWHYLRYGPFGTIDALAAQVVDFAGRAAQPFWVVRPVSSGAAEGWLSLCDIYPADAAIEIGSVWFSPRLQRTRASTEAIFLLMRHAFDDLGYERLVWRCDALNEKSMRAAARYGFKTEGIWRHAAIVRGRQRNVAWHSMLRSEWAAHKLAITSWLADSNFGPDGSAILGLSEIRASLLVR